MSEPLQEIMRPVNEETVIEDVSGILTHLQEPQYAKGDNPDIIEGPSSSATYDSLLKNFKSTFGQEYYIKNKKDIEQSAREILEIMINERKEIQAVFNSTKETVAGKSVLKEEMINSRRVLKSRVDDFQMKLNQERYMKKLFLAQKMPESTELEKREKEAVSMRIISENNQNNPYLADTQRQSYRDNIAQNAEFARQIADTVAAKTDEVKKAVDQFGGKQEAEIKDNEEYKKLDSRTKDIIKNYNNVTELTLMLESEKTRIMIGMSQQKADIAAPAQARFIVITDILNHKDAREVSEASAAVDKMRQDAVADARTAHDMFEFDKKDADKSKVKDMNKVRLRDAIDQRKNDILAGKYNGDENILHLNGFLANGTASPIAIRFINDVCNNNEHKTNIKKKLENYTKDSDNTKALGKAEKANEDPLLHAALIEICTQAEKLLGKRVGLDVYEKFGKPQKVTISDMDAILAKYNIENLGKTQLTLQNFVIMRAADWGVMVTLFNLLPTVIRGLSGKGWDLNNPYLYMGPAATYAALKILHEYPVGIFEDPHVNFASSLASGNTSTDKVGWKFFHDKKEMEILKMIDWEAINKGKKMEKMNKAADNNKKEQEKNDTTSWSAEWYWDIGVKKGFTKQNLKEWSEAGSLPILPEYEKVFPGAVMGLFDNPDVAHERYDFYHRMKEKKFTQYDITKVEALMKAHSQAQLKAMAKK